MRRSTRFALFGASVLGILVALRAVARRVTGTGETLVAELYANATTETEQIVADEEFTTLPAPVARYFRTVLVEGAPYVRTVQLHQRGTFRFEEDGDWHPFTATQHVTTNPPGFVWDAEIRIASLVPVRVIDAYKRGKGALRARLLSVVPVADAAADPELNEGELLRYLAESVWFPTALLPGEGVAWEAVDENAARATLEHRGTTASAVFHFDDGHVERIVAERPYRDEDGYERHTWTGYWRDYRERDGLVVPTEGEVEWNLPTGDYTYWRGRLEAIEYDATTG